MWRSDGMKLTKWYKIKKKLCENTKRNIVSQLRETTRNTFFEFSYFFQFREPIETRRNCDLFHTVSCFAKLIKKYETVNPSGDACPLFY